MGEPLSGRRGDCDGDIGMSSMEDEKDAGPRSSEKAGDIMCRPTADAAITTTSLRAGDIFLKKYICEESTSSFVYSFILLVIFVGSVHSNCQLVMLNPVIGHDIFAA